MNQFTYCQITDYGDLLKKYEHFFDCSEAKLHKSKKVPLAFPLVIYTSYLLFAKKPEFKRQAQRYRDFIKRAEEHNKFIAELHALQKKFIKMEELDDPLNDEQIETCQELLKAYLKVIDRDFEDKKIFKRLNEILKGHNKTAKYFAFTKKLDHVHQNLTFYTLEKSRKSLANLKKFKESFGIEDDIYPLDEWKMYLEGKNTEFIELNLDNFVFNFPKPIKLNPDSLRFSVANYKYLVYLEPNRKTADYAGLGRIFWSSAHQQILNHRFIGDTKKIHDLMNQVVRSREPLVLTSQQIKQYVYWTKDCLKGKIAECFSEQKGEIVDFFGIHLFYKLYWPFLKSYDDTLENFVQDEQELPYKEILTRTIVEFARACNLRYTFEEDKCKISTFGTIYLHENGFTFNNVVYPRSNEFSIYAQLASLNFPLKKQFNVFLAELASTNDFMACLDFLAREVERIHENKQTNTIYLGEAGLTLKTILTSIIDYLEVKALTAVRGRFDQVTILPSADMRYEDLVILGKLMYNVVLDVGWVYPASTLDFQLQSWLSIMWKNPKILYTKIDYKLKKLPEVELIKGHPREELEKLLPTLNAEEKTVLIVKNDKCPGVKNLIKQIAPHVKVTSVRQFNYQPYDNIIIIDNLDFGHIRDFLYLSQIKTFVITAKEEL